ncbi:MAG: MFS transporter [Pseudomonadota bacterium]
MQTAKIALVLVIVVDVMGQGLAFPIFSTLLLGNSAALVPAGTPAAQREFLYGLLISVFFFSWFLGAVYVSHISDSVGRKRGILICLTGALAGYLLTLVAIYVGSFWLLLVSRAVTGFTAGNQPIAQAAMVDLSRDEREKARNMGLVMFGCSLGLIGGPLVGAAFSAGPLAQGSMAVMLPFVVGAALIAGAMAVVAVFFRETSTTRAPLRIEPTAVFTLLWEITRRPVVIRIAVPYTLYMLSFMTFYVFFDTLLEKRFGYGTEGQSAGMLVLGAALAVTSTVLLPRIAALASPFRLVVVLVVIEIAVVTSFVVSLDVTIVFIAITAMGAIHAVLFPTFLGLFSKVVDAADQGWVMGVSIALFTLASAIASLVGGAVGEASVAGLFGLSIAAAAATLLAVAIAWRTPAMREVAGAMPA